MHLHHLFPAVLTLLAGTAPAWSLDILIPESWDFNITAANPFPVTLRDRSAPGGPVAVYLAINPPGSGINPVCVLFPSVATTTGIERTFLNVTIPANIGSEGRYYCISASPLRNGRSTGFYYSTRFTPAGMTGNFTEFEKRFTVGNSATLGCESYDCARRCSVRIVKPVMLDRNDSTESERVKAWDEEAKCIEQECPGAAVSAAACVGPTWGWLTVGTAVLGALVMHGARV